MLTGEGADESFLGYSRFNPDSLLRMHQRKFLYRHPGFREMLGRIWPVSKGKKLLRITRYHPVLFQLTFTDLNLVDELLGGTDHAFCSRLELLSKAEGALEKEVILNDQVCYLQPWLQRADRMGMAASMELRVPYTTVPMFSLANSMPYDTRVNQGERKAVLKKIAEKYCSNELIYRKKMGFGLPLDNWCRSENGYGKLFREILESDSFRQREFINHEFFNRLYSSHLAGSYRERNCGMFWTHLNLEMWYRIFFADGWKELVSLNKTAGRDAGAPT